VEDSSEHPESTCNSVFPFVCFGNHIRSSYVLDWTFSIRALQDSEIPWVAKEAYLEVWWKEAGKLVVCTASLARNNSDIKNMVYVHARVVA